MNINEYNEAVSSEKVVIVKFSAEWCQPCKALDSILKRLEGKFDNFKIVRIEVEDNPEITSEFGITNVPVLIYYKDGEIKDMTVGLQTEQVLTEKVDGLLK